MPTFDAATASVHVLTEKEGVLSAVAHDLELEVRRFTVTADDQAITARLEPGSLQVLHALKGGRASDALSAKDRKDILTNLAKEVLDPRGVITFASTSVVRRGADLEVKGTLTLNGKARPLAFTARRQGDRLTADVLLHQPDFGIRPFSAMLGALKVKAGVVVRLSLPAW